MPDRACYRFQRKEFDKKSTEVINNIYQLFMQIKIHTVNTINTVNTVNTINTAYEGRTFQSLFIVDPL